MSNRKNFIGCPCIEVIQPIGTFYIARIKAQELLKITYTDVRKLKDDLDDYFGIQRHISQIRLKEILEYVKNVDATFPTSIILAIPEVKRDPEDLEKPEETLVEYDQKNNCLWIKAEKGVAKIIDGQHRIAGLEQIGERKFELNVVVFVDMSLEDQAMVFATINLQQTKVNKSLAYDLFAHTKHRSPQKTCHQLARLLDKIEGGPFYSRIKMLGFAEGPRETITQATFIDSIISYISGNPREDRNKIKSGEVLDRAIGSEERRRIFRNLFLDEQDAKIGKIISNYFDSVKNRWPDAWDSKGQGLVLNRTTGFIALARLLRPVYLDATKTIGEVIDKTVFLEYFNRIELKDEMITSQDYESGAVGQSKFFSKLFYGMGLDESLKSP